MQSGAIGADGVGRGLATIRGRLGALLLGTALPLLFGATAIGAWYWWNEGAAVGARAVAQAEAAVKGVDAEIESRRLILEAFAAGRGEMDAADLAGVDAAARQVARSVGAEIGVLDRGLGLLIDTAQPFGTPLGSTPAVAAGLWAVETGRARVSGGGPVGSAPVAPPTQPMLMVPVLREGRTTSVLSITLSPERLAAAAGTGPAVLFDSRWRPIATIAGGVADLPDWTVLAAAPRGTAQIGTSSLGDRVRFTVSNLAEAPDWRLVTWRRADFATSLAGRLLPWVALCLGLTVAVALLLRARAGRALSEPVLALQRHARTRADAAAGDAPAPPLPNLGPIREFAALGAALAAADTLAAATERRLRGLAEAGAIVLWRADPAGGWIEAAGWAGLTGQTAPAFRGDGWLNMLHPDDRAPTLAEWGRSLVARNAIGVEFRLRTAVDSADWRWVRATGVPIPDEAGQLIEWVGAIHDVADARGAGTARQVNDAQVRQTVAELRAVYDTVPVGLSLVDSALRFVNVNARFAAISGAPPESHIGRAPHEVMPEGLARPLEDAQRRVFATGRPELDVTCSGPAPGSALHIRHWLASCHPVKDANGKVTGVSAVMQDVTERVRAEQSRELLVTELNHRVKNTLATVQSLAAQSLRGQRGAQGGLGREFAGRLQALMRAHDLLADQGWQEVDLARVVRTGLAPSIEAGRAIRFGGSGRIQVTAGQSQSIILALHELATNAALHGALSQPGGEVEVAWSLGEDGIATLDWRESGGPAVAPPAAERRGFGMRLLERGLAHDLGPGATVRLHFPESGVTAEMRFRAGTAAAQPVEIAQPVAQPS
ncbi:PAS domain-containing protein [Roseomonas terrae]|uniref:histidine kinase n=1 Tax=Neoroseomonas terrae TaxID=424799 RepID=A0ABS5EE58_9PROT|nr:PAS domain-containing protein [Neoroseomonas terrae]